MSPRIPGYWTTAELGQARDPLAEIGLRWKVWVDGIFLGARRGEQGCLIPDGYGVAYYDPGRDRCMLMPIPFNLFARRWRWLMIALRHGPT
ncbi:MAG: hypothetical protein ACRENC_02830, partial [Gemmatimonadaceae bacterium]